ncbi:hypothetical protein E3N88_44602 [Mikania micrantha]|uniref:Uncharacterized protein n=1 Tax=Mikania micrantha TaxID=192012 RepID=A0A5N6LBJ9_9ASTR|nr:hypothetical protein E3N88_44602 [Mikania micrantha]
MKTSSSGKYKTTQSDSTGRCFVNLNELDEEVEMDMPPPTSPQHPSCRNNKGAKQYNNDMKLLWTPTDHLTGRAREMIENTKERILKRYNMD